VIINIFLINIFPYLPFSQKRIFEMAVAKANIPSISLFVRDEKNPAVPVNWPVGVSIILSELFTIAIGVVVLVVDSLSISVVVVSGTVVVGVFTVVVVLVVVVVALKGGTYCIIEPPPPPE
jgi:hypothetical protein